VVSCIRHLTHGGGLLSWLVGRSASPYQQDASGFHRLCLDERMGGAEHGEDLALQVAMRFVAVGRGPRLNDACVPGRASARGRA
jgi:hypothetical protein